jgi:hypothetical protein
MHTHEYDCVVCGAHFDDEKTLQRHNAENHEPKLAVDVHAPAEPMGTERARNSEVNPSATADRNAPRYGSAGSGGAEFEPGPERD